MNKILWILVVVLCAPTSAMAVNSAGPVKKAFTYDDAGKRDPFWPLVSENGSIITYDEQDLMSSDMVLQGIMAGGDQNVAIINGKIVKKGDMIGAFRIEEVMSTFVVLGNRKEKVELHLRKEE